MDRDTLRSHILSLYGATPDTPWQDKPRYEVYRHASRRWFGVVMDIPLTRLGKTDVTVSDVINLKADPWLIPSLTLDTGIYPAYHMNKTHWISVVLGEIEEDKLLWLLDMSYDLTK